MSSPMPISPTMCSLCYGTVHEGEHWTDKSGQKWDSHIWCHLVDWAAVSRKHCGQVRQKQGIPTPEAEDREEREFFERQSDRALAAAEQKLAAIRDACHRNPGDVMVGKATILAILDG